MKEDNKIELTAGLTTFLTMSFIIIVNPTILSTPGTGMEFSGVLTATIMTAFLSTLFMGVYANLPMALASGMGLNAFFTYSLVLGEKIPWQHVLGLIFFSGLLLILLSFLGLRVKLANALPAHLRQSMACGIGLFLSFIGLKNASLITSHPETFVSVAPLSHQMLFSIAGLFIIGALLKRGNPASFLIGIVSVTLCSFFFGYSQVPQEFFSLPDFHSTFLQFDLKGASQYIYFPSFIALLMTDLFDSTSGFLGVATSGGFINEKGEVKNIKKALTVDSFATFFSSLFGTSPATTFLESSSGIQAGGRTGKTAIVVALCFLPFLFLGPLISVIPSYATAPALILIGLFMFRNISQINFIDFEKAIPSFLIIVLIPLSFSITQGLLWGLISHCVMYILTGKIKEIGFMGALLGFISALMLLLN